MTYSHHQIQVRAFDGGFPTLDDTTTVEVTVNRVTDTLTFFTSNYQDTIDENRAIGSNVVSVQAQPGVCWSSFG